MIVLACVMLFLLGWVWLYVVAPGMKFRMGRWWQINAAIVLGLFLTGLLNWVLLWLWPARPAAMLAGVETALLVIGACTAYMRRTGEVRSAEYLVSQLITHEQPRLVSRFLFVLAAGAMFVGLAQATWQLSASIPHGHWDAWMTWNLRARFLASDGQWQAFYTAPMAGQRQDYPMLLPITVARLWTYQGEIDTTAPRVVCVLAALLTLSIVMATLRHLRGRLVALLGGIVLLSSPFFITHAVSQYADTMQGMVLVMAASMLLYVRVSPRPTRGMWVLLGLFIGIVLNVKNEGIVQVLGLLLVTVLAMRFVQPRTWSEHRRRAIAIILGLAVPCLWLWHTKSQAVIGNDMVNNASSEFWQRLTDGSRHATIKAAWERQAMHAIDVRTVALLTAAGLLSRIVKVGAKARLFTGGICVLLLCVSLAGAYFAYLLAAEDLPSWLAQGSDRIFMQVWPLLVLGWATMLPSWSTLRAWMTPPSQYDETMEPQHDIPPATP